MGGLANRSGVLVDGPETELAGEVRDLMEAGVDGIYYAALGGERHFYSDGEFSEAIEPFDLQILGAAKSAGALTFLHICKKNIEMSRYAAYNELADVVNWGVYETGFSLDDGRAAFPGTTIMGGLANRSGVLVDGPETELAGEVRDLMERYGKRKFILGADCTLPASISYGRVRAAVAAARNL